MRNLFVRFLLCFVPGMATSTNFAQVEYSITIDQPHTHYAEVEISIKDVKTAQVHFRMPVWTPGSYLVREFEKSVELATATIGDKAAKISRPDKNTWLLENTKGKNVTIKYRIYAFEASVRTSFIDADHAFLHNTSVFMYAEEFQNSYGSLSIKYPAEWKNISTSLHQSSFSSNPKQNEGKWEFSNYDELADSPIEIGNHDVFEFTVMGVPHKVALVGENNCDQIKFAKDLELMCNTMSKIIGKHPCKNYLFIINNVESGGGGLEHLNSCCVWMGRWNWMDETKYRSFLGLCAHEYFHLWNVKRIRPIELGPFNYSSENYTDQLWVAEGITSYYDELALLRAGLIDKEAFVNTLEEYINTLENRPGSRVQTLAESSRDAWIKEYRPNENSKNTTISYYSKGLVVAALLDATICEKTKGKQNLDDLMRLLYNQYYMKLQRGFTSAEFVKATEEICGSSMDSFFLKHLYSLKKPDYEKIFSASGLEVKYEEKEEYKLGITTALENGKTIVKYIVAGSAAWYGGINVNDQIISINGAAINNDADDVLKKIGSPGILTVIVSRAGIVREISMDAIKLKTRHYDLEINTTPGVHSIALEKWLGK